MRRPWTIERRKLLRGAGGFAMALPLLNAMQPLRRARAQAPGVGKNGFPKRFLVWFTAQSPMPYGWRPSGGEADFALPGGFAPLEPHRSDLVVLNTLNNPAGWNQTGENLMLEAGHHTAGMTLLTGIEPIPNGALRSPSGKRWGFGGISVDQAIAQKIGAGTRFKSLQLQGHTRANAEGTLRVYLSAAGRDQALPNERDPMRLYSRLFSDLTADGAPSPEAIALRARRKSVLDAVKEDYRDLLGKVGGEDRQKLDFHATAIREMEASLDAVGGRPSGSGCRKPEPPGEAGDFRAKVKALIDLSATAFACDLTRVISIMWDYTGGQFDYPWLGVPALRGLLQGEQVDHHAAAHRPGQADDWQAKVYAFWSEQLAYLVRRLKAIAEGPGNVFDNTAILWTPELAHGGAHTLDLYHFLIVGTAGGAIKTGRLLSYPPRTRTNNDLHVSLLNAFGIPATAFGAPRWCKGPLPGLT